MYSENKAYTNIRVEKIPAFSYIRYAVISGEPEIIGWDFPFVSQEQINVYHTHGYVAACILPENINIDCSEIIKQESQEYAIITIKAPFSEPFMLIPNAYKTLARYIEVNGFREKKENETLSCFEREYKKEGISYMDVYIAVGV